jgi:hypothetical protein
MSEEEIAHHDGNHRGSKAKSKTMKDIFICSSLVPKVGTAIVVIDNQMVVIQVQIGKT